MKSSEVPSVAVLVDTSTGWGRRLIRGVSKFAKLHGPWDIWLEPRGQTERLRLPEGWRGNGVIARVSTRQMAQHLAERRIKTVNVSGIRIPGCRFARVATDEWKLARLAINHFWDCGIKRIGYVGLPHLAYSSFRKSALEELCSQSDIPLHCYVPRTSGSASVMSSQDSLRLWLRDLPKPIGIFTWAAQIGLNVLRAARADGFLVPDEIAVLSGDEDELLCETSRPSLSGVVVASEQIGYEAASVLAQAMAGKRTSGLEEFVSPSMVIQRTSTDVLSIEDPEVVDAVRFIRQNAGKPIGVSDVVEAVATSRRVLERRFKKEFERTLGEEIARVHLERAKYLLASTDLPIPKVADASGYGSPEYLASVFRKQTGLSPLKYRMLLQGR